jgi:glutamate/tyrosine decarboxylase-like PLP-dependent enzyme
MGDDLALMSAWFAGPKGENAPWFTQWLTRIADDYHAWRRNYFPEDGVVVDSAMRRESEPFADAFEDRLLELLARLKGDVPIHSPRYAAHMLAEQTLPAIAGYFAAMLYNPNNVTAESAPVTVRLELEAGRMLSTMIGHGPDAWAHLCSGGTAANIEALWAARTVRFLPWLVRDARAALGLADPLAGRSTLDLLAISPDEAMTQYAALWEDARAITNSPGLRRRLRSILDDSPFNVAQRGLGAVSAALGLEPVVLAPETHHYCFEKALDLLGIGRRGLISVRVDGQFRMRQDELDRTLDEVARSGRVPLAVVAVVGSTEEGSVDPIDEIVARRVERARRGLTSFWLHADGAYGGYLRTLTTPARLGLGAPNARVRIAGKDLEVPLHLPEHQACGALERLHECDSVTIDPHKLGYIPYPAGAICFRSNRVKPLMRQSAPYLADEPQDPEQERTSDAVGVYVLEGSKPGAIAASVWLSHSLIPLDTTGHGRLIRENIRGACELHALLEGFPRLTSTGPVHAVCLCPPGSNIVCYAFRRAQPSTLESLNRLNRALYERFSMGPGERVYDQTFFVSRTSLAPGQYSLATVGPFLDRLGVRREEYDPAGVFLLRSVIMNPWYSIAKKRGRYYIAELVAELYRAAAALA